MRINSLKVRPLAGALAAALTLSAVAPMAPRPEPGPVKVRASETTQAVHGTRDFDVSPDATHVAIHWAGHPDAVVTAAFSKDGGFFSEPSEVEIEDSSDGPDGAATDETYAALIGVDGVSVVRVTSDQPLARVSVLALDASGPGPMAMGLGAQADGATTIPGVIPRSAWGADESLRFDDAGDEQWPREFYPVQKLVVHHTAGRNADPNPAATVRAIYYYHAVTRRWADIGYNYLIDEAGRVYEGRYARDFWNGATPSSDNQAGLGVAAGHAKHYNQGTMGIALLGTFTSQAPTAAARASLVRMLAWASAKYNINPTGSGLYVNPKSGVTGTQPNITGHRDYQATSCPGSVVYAMMPQIRSEVSAQMNTWPGQTFNPPRTIFFAAGTYVGRTFSSTGAITGSKSFTLSSASSAASDQSATVPTQTGTWYHVTAGVWAGYWIPQSAGITLGAAPSEPMLTAFETARPLTVPAGTYVGRKFSNYGAVTSSKSTSLAGGSTIWTTQKSTIPSQGGSWYYVTVGVLEGYWIPEAAGMTLGDPPPPLPVPIAIYNPPKQLMLAPGTYTGRRFSGYGISAGTRTATLTSSASAPTSRYSTLPGQAGNWYYIIDGEFESYWLLEDPRITPEVYTTGSVTRIGGPDRYAVSANVSAATFAPGVPVAYVAVGTKFPDALSAGPAAALQGGPVLLTTTASLPASVAAELARLAPARIVVVGGTASVSDAVIAQLDAYTTGPVSRIGGPDRYVVAAGISMNTFAPGVAVAYVAVGTKFPDALAAGPAAAHEGGPVLLTGTDSLPASVAAELGRLNPQRIVVAGGPASVSDAVLAALDAYTTGSVSRIGGPDRYVVAAGISFNTFASADSVYLANGGNFPDALSGGPAAGFMDRPMLLTSTSSLPASIAAEISRLQPTHIYVLGGPASVSDAVIAQLDALLP